jgi:hypothetical protein
MKDEDKELLKDVGSEVISQGLEVVDHLANEIVGFKFVGNLCLSYFGIGIKYRTKKAIEFIENIRDNPEKITKELLDNEEFQDVLIYCFEKYLHIRSADKRAVARKVLMGYSVSSEKDKFEIERMHQVLENISGDGLEALMIIKTEILPTIHNQVGYHREFNTISKRLSRLLVGRKTIVFSNAKKATSEIFSEFISLGLFKINFEENDDDIPAELSYGITDFGLKFIEFVSN